MDKTPSLFRFWTLTATLTLIVSLSSCTSLEQRKQWSQKKFGPRCESAGYKAQSPAYFECIADEDRIWRINQMEKGNPYENWMPLTYLPSIADEKKE